VQVAPFSCLTSERGLQTEDVLNREAARVAGYLNPSSETPLLRVVERELLAKHINRLLDKESSGLRWLLRNKRKEDLARAYHLFTRVDGGLPPIAKIVKDHIQDAGMGIVRQRDAAISGDGKENPADPAYVQSLVDLHEDCKQVCLLLGFNDWALLRPWLVFLHKMVLVEFCGNTLFQKALKDAFEVFVNKESSSKFSNAELISTYCDRLLKGGM
jgi:cullin 1